MKSHIIEAQVATVNTCQHLYSSCLALFIWGRLLNIYLRKFSSSGKKNKNFVPMPETLRNFRPSRINVKTEKHSSFPYVNFNAKVVCKNYDQRLLLQTKDDKNARSRVN